MDKHMLNALTGIVAFLQVSLVYAQHATYSKEVEHRIRQVEEDLFNGKPDEHT
jgi:hypothetical protein